MAVNPGMVLISLNTTSPSSFTKKSTRESPYPSTALKIATAAFSYFFCGISRKFWICYRLGLSIVIFCVKIIKVCCCQDLAYTGSLHFFFSAAEYSTFDLTANNSLFYQDLSVMLCSLFKPASSSSLFSALLTPLEEPALDGLINTGYAKCASIRAVTASISANCSLITGS